MKYRLFASDLDGTLVTDDKRLTEETKLAVKEYMDRGGIVVLASGRPSYGVWHIAKELGLHERGGYILSYNGGELLDCKTGEPAFTVLIPQNRIPDIIGLSRKYQIPILTYEGSDVISESPDYRYVKREASNVHMGVREVKDLISYIDFPVSKFMMVGEVDQVLEMEPVVREALGPEFAVFRSEEHHLEIQPAGIDKGTGMIKTLDYLGIDPKDASACGDFDNDIPMIEVVGMGAAMGNACDALKEAADHVTGTNEEDGVAQFIRTCLL